MARTERASQEGHETLLAIAKLKLSLAAALVFLLRLIFSQSRPCQRAMTRLNIAAVQTTTHNRITVETPHSVSGEKVDHSRVYSWHGVGTGISNVNVDETRREQRRSGCTIIGRSTGGDERRDSVACIIYPDQELR